MGKLVTLFLWYSISVRAKEDIFRIMKDKEFINVATLFGPIFWFTDFILIVKEIRFCGLPW